ncbi:MAG: VCBS repeat-containing protein, partial [Deltaproteobacteria bacterium]|nr:VCBS repeat-containing protein [Deltaproteobacteria bacterium]
LAGYVPDLLRAGEGDKDGKLPDLLLCSSKGLLVSWGGPGGKHVPPLEVGIAGDIVDARFSDVTLDSHPDILVLVNAKGSVPGKVVLYRQVATSEGIGTRKYVMEEEWAVGTKPFSLEVADLEEDGRPDVVVADKLETQSVTLLRHSGKKPGQSQPQYWLQAPEVLTGVGGISWLSVVDVTLDGLPELVTAREDQGMVSVFVNLGKGNFPMAVDTVLVGSDVPFLDVADFDQDGYPDVAVLVEKVQAAYSLLGHGDGYFDPPLLLPGQTLEEFMKENISMILTPPAGGQEIGQGGALAYVGADSDSMVAGDFNLDGPADLAVCQESTGLVQFFHGTGTGEFTESLFLNVGQSPHSLVSGHFDGNDLPDFAVLNGNQCGVRFIYNYKKLLEGVPQDWCDGEAPGCVGEPSGGCQCKCMCHCPTPGNCWWKCGWVIEAGTACPDPSPCEQEPLDDLCGCDAKCKCSCTLSGSANCKWEVEHHVLQPECQGQPPTCDMGGIALDPDCGCATSCGCYCSVDGAGWCGWGYYWPYVGEEECEGSKKCAGQTCSGVGSCSGSGKPGQQCICKCGCDCDCKCKCMCGFGGNDSSCKWDCKSKCGWQCAWEDPPPPPPEMLWVTSGEIPMPVNPNTGLGRLKPLRVALDDFDLDGITDAVVALQSVQMEDCVDGVVKPSAWVKSVLFVSGAQSIAGGLGFSASKVEELGKEEITLLASARLDGDPFPDLVVATKHKGSICDGSSSDDANFDLMTGGHWVGWSVLGVPQGGCSWDGEVFPSPGGFRGSGGFEIEGEPRDVAVAQLEGLPAGSQDLIVLRGGSGTPGTPNYLPDAVGVYMAYGTDEAPECSLPLMTYLEQCAQGIPVDWTCQALSFLTAQCCSPSQEAIYPKLGLKPMAIEAEDMDNDGVLDVVVANQESNNIAVLFGGIVDSKYVLNPPGKASQLVAVGSAPTDVEAGDVDGDGWADLVVALAGKVAVSWGVDGKSFLTPAYLVGPGGGPLAASKVSVADLNFDGKQDLVVLSAKDSMIYLYYSAGDRKLIGPFTYGVGKGPVDLDVAELNGDGCLDLVVANEGSRTVTFIINGWCSKP